MAQQDVLERAQHYPLRARPSGSGGAQCLVVAADPRRRSELIDAATTAGWTSFGSDSLESVLVCQRRLRLQLAIIDLYVDTDTWPRHAVEELARQGELLVVVCGGSGTAEEEVWSRQQGVWIYLPGLSDAQGLCPILGEARDLAARLMASRGSAFTGAVA